MELSTKSRKALPKSSFGVPSKAPGSGSYPMPDPAHAANAKARAKQQFNKGRMAAGTLHSIFAKADRKLGGGR